MHRWELAVVMAIAAAVYCVAIARRAGYPVAMLRTLVAILSVAAVSLFLGSNIERNGNGFFTADALFEGLAVLLIAHLLAIALRALAERSGALTTTAALIADVALDGIALLMLGFVVFAAFRQHVPAGSLLIVAGVYYAVLILFLAPHAIAGARLATYARPHSLRRNP